MPAPAPAPRSTPFAQRAQRPRPWLWGGAALTLLLGSALALAAAQPGDVLAPGVSVGGVAVGGLTPQAAEAKLAGSLPQPPTVTVKAGANSWAVPATELGWQRDLGSAVKAAEHYSNSRGLGARLGQMVGQVTPRDFPVTVQVDEKRAAAKLTALTAPLAVKPQGGDLKFDAATKRYVVTGGRDGKAAQASAAAKAYAADPGLTNLQVSFGAVTSAYSPAKLQAQAEAGNALIRPVTVQLQGTERRTTLDAMQVANLFWATRDGIKPDAEAIEAAFGQVAAQVNDPAAPARFVSQGGQWVPKEGHAGHELLMDEALAVFRKQVLDPATKTVTLPGRATQPPLSTADLPDPAGLELIASGSSTYHGSSAERRENIRVAAQKIDGYVVPKDGEFSFLQALGSITPENGFVGGLIISGGRTVDGLGGGVCQVSTTAFRGLYRAGLPVVERNQHSYRVKYYEPEVGFEAAVYDPGLDLKMKNDTGAPLVVKTVNDDAASTLRVELWGKKPARTVKVSDAVITSSTPAPAPKWVETGNLPSGQVRQVDWAQPGYTLYITRTITDASGTRTDRIDTNYQAWQAVFERGR